MDFAYQPAVEHHCPLEESATCQNVEAAPLQVLYKEEAQARNLTLTQSLQSMLLLKTGLFLKKEAFASMQRLEGWCSKEKASVLIDLILAVKPSVVVEIGVFGGKSLVPMALALRHTGQGVVYGVDPWMAEKSADGLEGKDLEWWSSLDHDFILHSLLQEIARQGLHKEVHLIRTTSEDCPPIPNIDILHIDGNHSEKASVLDVNKWVPLVKDGGLIIFDDLDWDTTHAATTWLDQHCHRLAEFRGDNVWCIWIK